MATVEVHEQQLWLRRLVVGALVAVTGPPALGLALAVSAGGRWHVEGWGALVVGVAWLAGFGLLGAALARTRPVVLGALAGEGFAIGSLLDASTADQALSALALSMGAGMLGAGLATLLVRFRPPTSVDDATLAIIAIVSGVLFVAAFIGDGGDDVAEDDGPQLMTVNVGPSPPSTARYCDLPGPDELEEGVEAEFAIEPEPDRAPASGPIKVRYDVELSDEHVRLAGKGAHQTIELLVLPAASNEVIYRAELMSGPLRQRASGVAEVRLDETTCGPAGPPPPGRYRAHMEVRVTGDFWRTPPVPLTLLGD